MAHDDDWSWMLLSRSTDEWQAGLEKFIDTIFEGTYASELHRVHVQGVVELCTKQNPRFKWTC